nr:killer cell lectin-like receptor 2 [Meriones unguiculatus]
MSDQDITYTTVRFHKSSGLQNGVRPREAGYRKCSVSWKLIVIPLGIFCSLLLVTVTVLVIHIFQEKHEQENILNNLHQENYTLKSNISLKEEMLKNKSIEINYLKGQLDFLKRQRNRCHEETKIILGCSQPTEKCVEGRWFCCGIKCYYLIKGDKPWSECSHTCQDCSLSLLKIDDDVELKFDDNGFTTCSRRMCIPNFNSCIVHSAVAENKETELEYMLIDLEQEETNRIQRNGHELGFCSFGVSRIGGAELQELEYHSEAVLFCVPFGVCEGIQDCKEQLVLRHWFPHRVPPPGWGADIISRQLLSKMSSQEVTYSNSRFFESSSESQNPMRPNGTQGPRETGNKGYGYQWTTLNLGMNFLLLLMSLGVFSLLTSHCSGSRDPLLTSDDGDLSVADIQDLVVMDSVRVAGNCAFLSSTGIHDDDCGRSHSCICEKRLDKFPVSMCGTKER